MWIIAWIVSYVVFSILSILLIMKADKRLTVEDVGIVCGVGMLPAGSVLILAGLCLSYGSDVVLWRKK